MLTVPDSRDLRLDVFRGLANWAIFLDHIPNNVVAWITARNYGFSDAAELFVFISGYTVALVFGRQMQTRGFIRAGSGLIGRVWQIYVAHILVFVVYVVAVGYVAQRYDHAHLLDEFNIRRLIADPVEFLKHGLLLEFKPLNLDVLPLYIVLMAAFVPVLWFLNRWQDTVLAASFSLYLVARGLGWNLPSYPSGQWYFNPLAWQFLFIVGAWLAIGGSTRISALIRSNIVFVACVLFLAFACVATLSPRLGYAPLLPDAFAMLVTPNDKTNLAPYRILHILALVLVVTRLLPRDAAWLRNWIVRPAVLCGQQSLEVFCAGLFLSFIGYFLIEIVSSSGFFQCVVSLAGIAIMTGVAAVRSWAKSAPKIERASPARA